MKEMIIDRVHTTSLGLARIRDNLGLPDKQIHGRLIKQSDEEVIKYCKEQLKKANVVREGKNWYACTDTEVFTINVYSHTIITAHKKKVK